MVPSLPPFSPLLAVMSLTSLLSDIKGDWVRVVRASTLHVGSRRCVHKIRYFMSHWVKFKGALWSYGTLTLSRDLGIQMTAPSSLVTAATRVLAEAPHISLRARREGDFKDDMVGK